jgi:DNA-directed RNA polymerase beta subunit
MATNQIIESLLAQVAAIKGVHIDGTAFVRHDFDAAFKFLEARGIKYGGYHRLYNGKTGNWITSLIFVGPTTYQRLEKFVEDEHYATAAGPSSAITHQPLDGKNNDGGLRIGEMEKDVHMVHGVQRTLYSKFTDDSDGVDIYICANCKKHAVVNAKLGIYKCKRCGDAADIAAVSSTWVADLFFKEASAMNMDLSFELEPHTYSQMQGSDK